MKKKVISIIMVVVVTIMTTNNFVVDNMLYADETSKSTSMTVEAVAESEIKVNDVITDRLKECLSESKGQTVPVTVQIKDNIDLAAIEQEAMKKVGLTAEELEQMDEYARTLSEEENKKYQQEISKVYEEIREEKKCLVKEYYEDLNYKFIEELGWDETQYDSVGMFTPFVRNVELSANEIYDLSETGMVNMIDYAESETYETIETSETYALYSSRPSVNDTISIIRGDVAIDNGYTGSGIKVGVVENGLPMKYNMGSDGSNITWVNYSNGGQLSSHTTIVCGIIKKMAPSCSIYSYYSTSNADAIDACELLIDTYGVQVINISYGSLGYEGNFNSYSVELDQIVRNMDVTVVVAAGNIVNPEHEGHSSVWDEINDLAMAPNVIAVGAVESSGTDMFANGAYTMWEKSCFREINGTINRPDICAPGSVSIYSYSDVGTSFATPHITGTAVQMMSRNSGLRDKPEIIKAALLASAKYGSVTNKSFANTLIDDKEGAGVVDAGFCYDVAKNGRRTHVDWSTTTSSYSYNVYCDSANSPFRVACAWEAVSNTTGTTNCVYYSDYDMALYKDGRCVGSSCSRYSSTGINTNYEIIELTPEQIAYFGAGYYEVRITMNSQMCLDTVRIGLAWEQP